MGAGRADLLHGREEEWRMRDDAERRETEDACGVDDPLYRRTSFCPNCRQTLERRRCKALCTRCGYFDSCSDLL